MPFHKAHNLCPGIVVEFQSAHNLLSISGTDLRMLIKNLTAAFNHLFHIRLAKVVHQHGETQHFVRHNIHHRPKGMFFHIINMVRRVLTDTPDSVIFRQNNRCNTKITGQTHVFGMVRHKNLHQFHLYTLGADILKLLCLLCNRCFCRSINFKTKLCRKTNCTHNAQSILIKAFLRHTDTADNLSCQIADTVKGIHNSFIRIVRHSINRKIAAL